MVEQMLVLVLSLFSLRNGFWRGLVNVSWKSLFAFWAAWSVPDHESGSKPALNSGADLWCSYWRWAVSVLRVSVWSALEDVRWSEDVTDTHEHNLTDTTSLEEDPVTFRECTVWSSIAFFSFVDSHDLLSNVKEDWDFLWLVWLWQMITKTWREKRKKSQRTTERVEIRTLCMTWSRPRGLTVIHTENLRGMQTFRCRELTRISPKLEDTEWGDRMGIYTWLRMSSGSCKSVGEDSYHREAKKEHDVL